jgi:cholesterol transport system auxiliary component
VSTIVGSRRVAALCALLCACTVPSGCTGSLFKSKAVPPSVYLLSAHAAPAQSAVAADLTVMRPRLRAGLDTDRIAVLYPDKRLDYFADARWSGPLDEVVQDLTVQAFAGGGLRNVSADGSAFASGYWLEVQVDDFQAEYAASGSPPTVHVRFTARLGTAGDRKILGSFQASADQAASDNRLTAIVDAFEHACDAALGQLVADTTRTLAGGQNPRS